MPTRGFNFDTLPTRGLIRYCSVTHLPVYCYSNTFSFKIKTQNKSNTIMAKISNSIIIIMANISNLAKFNRNQHNPIEQSHIYHSHIINWHHLYIEIIENEWPTNKNKSTPRWPVTIKNMFSSMFLSETNTAVLLLDLGSCLTGFERNPESFEGYGHWESWVKRSSWTRVYSVKCWGLCWDGRHVQQERERERERERED